MFLALARYGLAHALHYAAKRCAPELHSRPVRPRAGASSLRAIAHVGGLHHHYEWVSSPDETPHERLAA